MHGRETIRFMRGEAKDADKASSVRRCIGERCGWIVVLLAFAAATFGQTIGHANPQPATPPPPQQIEDPLGRTTPRGTITGFIKAVHREDYDSAAWYMQVTAKQKPRIATLARDLKALMDRYFNEPLEAISDSPLGTLDGVAPDRERIGPLTIGGEKIDILLVRVDDPEHGPIWLISSDTLARVPALYDVMEETWLERMMPQPLLDHSVLGISLAQWVSWAASIAIPLLLLWLASKAFIILFLTRIDQASAKRRLVASWYSRIRWPATVVLVLGIHAAAISLLGFSLESRIIYLRVVFIALVLALAWLARRVLTIAFERARLSMQRRGETGTESLMLLSERILKVLVILVAIFAALAALGVDTKTALAGVGIGGVAIALGAQKTVENLLGGVFLLTDKAIAVGDVCRISDRVGTVEDITLRSIRLRTLEQTLLSVPAGTLSQETIENFTTRTKILVQSNLQLRYGTTAEQLKSILERIHGLLNEVPEVEAQTARVRLTGFGVRAIELEVFAYVLTSDNAKFLSVREILLLQIATIVESSGSGFASPTQFVYLDRRVDSDEQVHELDSPKPLGLQEGREDIRSQKQAVGKRFSQA